MCIQFFLFILTPHPLYLSSIPLSSLLTSLCPHSCFVLFCFITIDFNQDHPCASPDDKSWDPQGVPELQHCCIEVAPFCLHSAMREGLGFTSFTANTLVPGNFSLYKRCSVTPLGWFLEYTSSTSRYKETLVHGYFVPVPLGYLGLTFPLNKV